MKTKDEIIEEVLSTDQGIDDISEALSYQYTDPVEKQRHKEMFIAMFQTQRALYKIVEETKK